MTAEIRRPDVRLDARCLSEMAVRAAPARAMHAPGTQPFFSLRSAMVSSITGVREIPHERGALTSYLGRARCYTAMHGRLSGCT